MSMPQEDLFFADQILRQAVLMLELRFKIFQTDTLGYT